jgi:hypothetical protein
MVPIFDKKIKFRGQMSSVDTWLLGAGEYEQVLNFRTDDQTLRIRNGIVEDADTDGLPADRTFLGGISHELGRWQAVGVGGKTEIYKWSGSAWVEITDATTRFPRATHQVDFTIVSEKVFAGVAEFSSSDNTYLMWQNGIDAPRIRNTSSSGSYTPRILSKFQPPPESMCKVRFIPTAFFNTQSISARTNSGGGISSATNTASGYTFERFSFTTSTTLGAHATVQFTSAIALANTSKQMHVVFKSSDQFVWSRCRVSLITSAGTEYILYDPTLNVESRNIVPIDDTYSQLMLDISTIYDTSKAVDGDGLEPTD